MRLQLLPLLSSLASLALADVLFTLPAAGGVVEPGSFQITWKDSGVAPAISTFASYELFLIAGGNDANIMAIPLVPSGTFGTNTATGTITPAFAGEAKNAYYLKMQSTSSEGGLVINYSQRFTITGMTGAFPPNVLTAITALAGSVDAPATVNQVSNGAGADAPASAAPAGGEFTVPYQLQTGLTKYAPMQPVPPTKIVAKKPTPLHPTSAFVIARTWLPPASVATTLTLSQTFSVSSVENTIAAASAPTGDMAKFLARWKD